VVVAGIAAAAKQPESPEVLGWRSHGSILPRA